MSELIETIVDGLLGGLGDVILGLSTEASTALSADLTGEGGVGTVADIVATVITSLGGALSTTLSTVLDSAPAS